MRKGRRETHWCLLEHGRPFERGYAGSGSSKRKLRYPSGDGTNSESLRSLKSFEDWVHNDQKSGT
jgi:hypothetical protein